MALWLKQSTSVDVGIGPFLDEIDGRTAETALTITQPDIRLKKNGGAWAQKAAAQTLSHEENGWYEVTLDATDTNTLGVLQLYVNETGALPVMMEFMVLPANVWDSLFGSDKLDVNVAEWLGTAAATPTVAGVPEVDVTHWGGTAVASAVILAAANIAADALTAAKFAADVGTEIGTAVWATTTRVLTAATNLGIAAADIRSAVGLGSANLDTQLGDLPGEVWDEALAGHVDAGSAGLILTDAVADIGNVLTALGDVPADTAEAVWDALTANHTGVGSMGEAVDALPTANENADALLDRAAGIETNRTVRQGFRLMLAALTGKASGLGTTTATYRDTNDSVDRIVATVDVPGNRSAVTLDAS